MSITIGKKSHFFLFLLAPIGVGVGTTLRAEIGLMESSGFVVVMDNTSNVLCLSPCTSAKEAYPAALSSACPPALSRPDWPI